MPQRYLDGLPDRQRVLLESVNGDGIRALCGYLAGGEAIAFLGAGASVPLYPLWAEVVGKLVDVAAAAGLSEQAVAAYRALASTRPNSVVELVRRELGAAEYRQALREVFRVRRDPATGRTWTATHELVARCAFKAVVTTNYDPGILDARIRVRPKASSTGFATWADEDAMDQWRTGDVFGGDELPVLFAHGHHNRPEDVVLATAEYRRAYAGKLGGVLGRLIDSGHLVWIGFSFADQRIAAVVRSVAEEAGTRLERGGPARHVAVMPWDPGADGGTAANDPSVLATLAKIDYGCRLVLYPAPCGDHTALKVLLEDLTDPRWPPVPDLSTGVATAAGAAADGQMAGAAVASTGGDGRAARAGAAAQPGAPTSSPPGGSAASWLVPENRPAVRWVHGGTPVEHFTGRADELARLDRWAADPQVRLIGVTAWGGAGKTALVTEWLTRHGGLAGRAMRGLFAWNFYQNQSAEEWAQALLDWAEQAFDLPVGQGPLAARVLAVARAVPLAMLLDGLEVLQEGPAGAQFGRLLDGTLREVLTGWCLLDHPGLAVLTSRFPFADLEGYDGASVRMLEVPPLLAAEGAAILKSAGAGWLAEPVRRDLVTAVDGHALAVGVLAAALAQHPPTAEIHTLRNELYQAQRTDARVAKVLTFYADRLSDADRQLVAMVSLFHHPVTVEKLVQLGSSERLGGPLRTWTPGGIETAVRQRLQGLLSWHPDQTVSAHPLVRDTFRPLVLTRDAARLASDVTLADLPRGPVRSREDAAQVVEMVELLLDANEWEAADNLYAKRSDSGWAWQTLPAARLGVRAASAFAATLTAASAFAATPHRRHVCGTTLPPWRTSYYLNQAGLHSMIIGDMDTAQEYLRAATDIARADRGHPTLLPIALQNLCRCLGHLGQTDQSRDVATQALEVARATQDKRQLRDAHVYYGTALDIAGETAAAETTFITADIITLTGSETGQHLPTPWGLWWADFLIRTGRAPAARQLIENTQRESERHSWRQFMAGSDRLLGLLELAAGNLHTAGSRLTAAVQAFGDGDFLIEWVKTLPDLAEHARLTGEIDHAEQLCTQAITAAGPRRLVPAHARALAVRATVRADRYDADCGPGHLAHARDDADHALRLATNTRRLPWAELDALVAHVHIDHLEGRDHGWQARTDLLRASLIPPDLDPNPIVTAEQQATQQDN